jgi:hypothetical protein
VRRTARRGGGVVVGAVAAALFAFIQPAAMARPSRSAPAHTVVHHALVLAPHAAPGGGTVDSANWSGYVDRAPAGGQITSVTGHWIVPSAQALPPGYSAAWTGIGGFGTSDLIQAGTTTNSFGGAQYYAWFELLPDAETPIVGCSRDPSCTVNAGDSVAVHITSTGGDGWRIQIDDQGHWSWSSTVSYPSKHLSAEWILESPSVGTPSMLANVGAVTFDEGNGYGLDRHARLLGQGAPIMVRLNFLGLTPVSVPSAVDADADGFRACAYGASCAPPTG